ncbi:hypothetical protein BCU22_020260 [Vibrio cyclitrophicus]|uniref:hypothetical protein n=1 Tax=Vibrio cyclitrophicus TaxID=47951 RepID=UPI0039B08403
MLDNVYVLSIIFFFVFSYCLFLNIKYSILMSVKWMDKRYLFFNYFMVFSFSLIFIYLSGEKNDFISYSPGSDSDLFIYFLKVINLGLSSSSYDIFSANSKNAYLEILSPIFNAIEPGSLFAICVLVFLNFNFILCISTRILNANVYNVNAQMVSFLVLLCPLASVLMVSYLRDIFSVFLAVEICYLLHRNKERNLDFILILVFSVMLFYTRSFYLYAIVLGYIISTIRFNYIILLSVISFFLVFLFLDLQPLLTKLLVLHGGDNERLGNGSLSVDIDNVSNVPLLLIVERLVRGAITMLLTPQPGFIINDIIHLNSGSFKFFEDIFQLIFSYIYVALILPITFVSIKKLNKVILLDLFSSKFHVMMFSLLLSIFIVYSIKFFGVRHYKVDFARHIFWVGFLSFFPLIQYVKTKLFAITFCLSNLLSLLITIYVLL